MLELGRLAANDRRRGCVVYLGRRRRRRRRVGGAGTALVKACRDSSSAKRMRATFAPKFSHLPEELVGVVMMFYAHVGFY